MASQFQAIPQLHTSFSNSSRPDDGSSSDTPGGSRASSGRYSYSNGSMSRSQRGSVDYSSTADIDVGYTSAASNSTFIPPYTVHHSQRFVSPMYEQSQSNPISPQTMMPTGPGGVQSPEQYVSPGAVVANNGGNAGSVAQSSPAAAQYRRAPPATPPVPLACTECRLRHLKCDAGTPTCGRCRAEGRSCCYVKSRRGWKGRKRKGSTATSVSGMTSGTEASETGKGESGGEGDYVGVPRLPNHYTAVKQQSPALLTNPLETLRSYHKNSTQFQAQHEHVPHAPAASLIQLYYAYFHSSHPFMLPPAYLVKTHAAKLTHLMPVVRFIGSFYAPNAPRDSFRDAAEYTLFRQNAPRNGFTVQAMLLFAIGLHAANEQEKSSQVKDVAVEIAIEIGMNREEFAYFGGEKIPEDILMTDDDGGGGMRNDGLDNKRNTEDPVERVMQESWRRTWWELYFLDGILAGVHQRVDGFRLWMIECSVPLPCEEVEYNNGRIPPPMSLQDFDDRTFSDEPLEFSSYAYRVEAIRILGQVLACGRTTDPDDPRADAADASLVNWALHLPEEKKELVGKDRKVDEMLFQAHMIVYATSIYLHRPRSHLVVSLVSDETTCTPTTGYTASHHPIIFHTSKAVHAANAISKLVTLPTPLIKHTPFFTCVLTLATVVHLSACSWLLSGDEGYLAKERIRLGIGALRTLDEVWGIAGCVLHQVKGAAREVFRFPRPEGWAELLGTGGPTGVITEEEMMKFIEEEAGLEGDVAGLGPGDGELASQAGVLLGQEVGEEVLHGVPGLEWDGS